MQREKTGIAVSMESQPSRLVESSSHGLVQSTCQIRVCKERLSRGQATVFYMTSLEIRKLHWALFLVVSSVRPKIFANSYIWS